MCKILLILFLLIPTSLFSQENRILAVVGKKVITQQDLNNYLQMVYLRLSQIYNGEELEKKLREEKENALQNLVQDKLLLQEAQRLKLTLDDYWIDKEINKIKKRFSSQGEFLEALQKKNLTLSDLRNRIKEQLLIEALIDREVRSKIKVSPAQITQYYFEHQDKFKTKGEYKLWVKVFDDENQAQDFYESQKKNLDLKEFSDFGWQPLESLSPEVKEKLSNSRLQTLIEPIKLEGRYYIFYLEAKRPPRVIPLKDAKDKIRSKLFKEKFMLSLKSYANSLKKRFIVKVYD